MSDMRLDEEKLEALRSWGERLRESGGEEFSAVGRAILMLVEEIDRLHIELWHARIQPGAESPPPSEEVIVEAAEPEEPVTSSLQARLRRLLRSDAPDEPVEPSVPEGEDDATTAAQAWIAALRRED